MKGLLLKEWYMLIKNLRINLLIMALFLILPCVVRTGKSSEFIMYYPFFLCGMIPINLLSLDEQSGWLRYSGALPYTKSQFVSAKYLISLFALGALLAAAGVVRFFLMGANGTIAFQDDILMPLLLSCFMFACISVGLPFVFWFGTDKGRIIYLVTLGIFFGLLYGFSDGVRKLPSSILQNRFPAAVFPAILAFTGIVLYALSWYLSVVLYRKREI